MSKAKTKERKEVDKVVAVHGKGSTDEQVVYADLVYQESEVEVDAPYDHQDQVEDDYLDVYNPGDGNVKDDVLDVEAEDEEDLIVDSKDQA